MLKKNKILRNVTKYIKREILNLIYTLYIHKRDLKRREQIMALANLKKIDKKLQDIYKDQVTTTVAVQPEPFVDKSDLLFEQMNFIAAYNKQLLHIA